MVLLVDASFYIALADPKDQWHAQARALGTYVKRNGPLVTHALAVGEVVAVVASAAGGKAARVAYDAIMDTAHVRFPSKGDFDDAMAQVVRFDGTLSLSDSLLMLYAQADPKRRIVSFDSDFDGKGVLRVSRLAD